MTSSNPPPDATGHSAAPLSDDSQGGWRTALLARHPWLGYVLPLVIFLVLTSCEPAPPDPAPVAGVANDPLGQVGPADQTGEKQGWFDFSVPYRAYPFVYTAKIALSIAAIFFVWPVYRQFPWRLSWLAFVVGAAGVVIWVGLCHLGLERRFLPMIGLDSLLESGQRTGFNPLVELAGQPAWAYGFLAIRFLGLALVVPLIEEFFLRGFVMRLCVHENWWSVPFGTVTPLAVLVGTAVPMAMHPAELLAALVWFTMVTGLMVATRNIWDCVVAHATTNLLLGIYVVVWNQWQLM